MSTTQGIKLDDTTQARLKALAAKRDRSAHWLMRAAIERYLDSEERYEQEKSEDTNRWETYVTTGKSVANDDVKRWLNSLANGDSTPKPTAR